MDADGHDRVAVLGLIGVVAQLIWGVHGDGATG
jgi:hypothetical protein